MVGAYLAERFSLRVFVPMAVVIAGAASGGALSGARLLLDAAFGLLLLAQFRSWDDLADRGRDAVSHPERVLVRAMSTAPLVAFSGALAILNICLAIQRDGSGVAVAVLVALIGVLGTLYSLRTTRTVAGDHLLLSKYAVMVIVVAGARVLSAPVTILCVALALHLAVWLYEVWHDPASPLSIGGHR
jgi:4-hydroxybenzoate polyprenyltransferase